MNAPDFVRIPVAVVRARVMRHRRPDGPDEVAVHDVHFAPDGTVVTRSFEARSPRFPDVESLYGWLSTWRRSDAESMVCGDLGEEYSRDDLHAWQVVELPVLEYEGSSDSQAPLSQKRRRPLRSGGGFGRGAGGEGYQI